MAGELHGFDSGCGPRHGRQLPAPRKRAEPFTTGTTLRFSARAAGDAGIRIFDPSGRLVRNLDRHVTAGSNEIRWDGRDEQGRAVPSGILFYGVTAGGTRQTGRMVRLSR